MKTGVAPALPLLPKWGNAAPADNAPTRAFSFRKHLILNTNPNQLGTVKLREGSLTPLVSMGTEERMGSQIRCKLLASFGALSDGSWIHYLRLCS